MLAGRVAGSGRKWQEAAGSGRKEQEGAGRSRKAHHAVKLARKLTGTPEHRNTGTPEHRNNSKNRTNRRKRVKLAYKGHEHQGVGKP